MSAQMMTAGHNILHERGNEKQARQLKTFILLLCYFPSDRSAREKTKSKGEAAVSRLHWVTLLDWGSSINVQQESVSSIIYEGVIRLIRTH